MAAQSVGCESNRTEKFMRKVCRLRAAPRVDNGYVPQTMWVHQSGADKSEADAVQVTVGDDKPARQVSKAMSDDLHLFRNQVSGQLWSKRERQRCGGRRDYSGGKNRLRNRCSTCWKEHRFLPLSTSLCADSKAPKYQTCEMVTCVNKRSRHTAGSVHIGEDDLSVGAGAFLGAPVARLRLPRRRSTPWQPVGESN